MTDNLSWSIEVAKEAVRAAAEVLRGSHEMRGDVRRKDDGSVVSRADEDAEAALRDVITRSFPGDRVLGEEGGSVGRCERCWVADPLDNSACYLRGSSEYAVILGLLEGGRPKLGVVLTPSDGSLWWAAEGHGAWGPEGQKLRCSQVTELSSATISFASLKTWRSLSLAEQLGSVTSGAFHESLHGGFRGMLAVAAGTVDLCLDPWGKLWDHAGLVPLLTQSGAICRRLDTLAGQAGFVTGPAPLVNLARKHGLPIMDEEWDARSYGLI